MDVLLAVLSFSLVAGLLTIIPGADTALVLHTAIRRGRKHAYAAAVGICGGCLVWGAGAAAGISVLLTASRTAYAILRIAGAIYLVYLGTKLLRDAIRKRPIEIRGHDTPDSVWRSWRQGFINNLLNPKAAVFYVAMLPQFLPPDGPALPMGLLLALVHAVEGIIWFSVIIGGVSLTRRWLQGDSSAAARIRRSVDAITGTVLIGLGIKLGGAG